MSADGIATVSGGGASLSSQVGAAVGASTTGFVGVPSAVMSAAGTSNADAYTAASIDINPPVDRGIVLEQVGVGASRVIVPDTYRNPFNIGVGCEADGPVTYSIEHTFEDVFDPSFSAASAVWFANSGLSDKTASANGNYAYPVNGIRLRISAGAGTVRAYIVQAGTR